MAKKKKPAPTPYHPYKIFHIGQQVVIGGRAGIVVAVIGSGPNATVYVRFPGWHQVSYRAYQL